MEGDYGPPFSRDEFKEMAERPAQIKGRFRWEGAETIYTIQAGKSQGARDLIVMGGS